ncbi:MAG: sigma-54-dependent Fis family transcriptional regulator [bacterium]|nr:sigma-54-dependent Fis family transcriptional regulator [bacterium]
MHVLISWIGHTDLKVLLDGADDSLRKQIETVARPPYESPKDGGPIKTLISHEKFDKIYFLSDFSKELTDSYINWLRVKAKITFSKLNSPTDYSEIYNVVADFMAKLRNELEGKKYELSILLSPGTPAMAAIWVLLGKTKYNATFWQTWNGKAKCENIPFDITLDVVPELISSSDSVFNYLASLSPREIKGFEEIIGDTKAIRLAVGRAQKAAIRDVAVLLKGESGTGKEMFARAIHKASRRHDKSFIPINCAAIPKELLESELFGHAKSAFTGADRKKDGAFKQADGGILFLDEIGECDPQLQAKLLRVLQPQQKGLCHREFYPIGATKPETADVRVIAATNRDLLAMIEQNLFREDLFYRLAVITIKLPSLRDRKADIPYIAQSLLDQINHDFAKQETGYKHKKFYSSTTAFMKKHDWPGNVRELYNAILQAAVMSEKEIITPEDIKAALIETFGSRRASEDLLEKPLGDGFNLEEHLNSVHRHYLRRAMQEANGVKTRAAELLGLNSYQAMDAQIERLKVDLADIVKSV